MASSVSVDIKELVLANNTFGPNEVQAIIRGIAEDGGNHRALREAVQSLEQRGDLTPAMKVRLGVCYYLLGRYPKAVEYLSKADGGALALFYLAKTYHAQGEYEKAVSQYALAAQAGYAAGDCALGKAESLRCGGKVQESLAVLDDLSGPVEQTAEYLYQRGATIAAIGGNPDEVVALYERAVQADGSHQGALFGLALENDRRGNDEEAMSLYERAARQLPAHVGTLLNLGILYEDHNRFELAARCYQRILDDYPGHAQARLYLKDARASTEQDYDEDAVRRQDRLMQVLNIPVTDFELSVRSRNCLQRMGIQTLGDLTKITEQQLLASKNFGETSLVEIREIMQSKGLEIGQFATERTQPDYGIDTESLSQEEQALINKPVSDLNLSVRARKCMIRLGIQTIGELIRRTGDELLECKNFGVTSLNEVREKLAAHGLKLRGD